MSGNPPELYFRIRDTGAVVFRLDSTNRQRRLDLEEIASVNIKTGNIKAHGDRVLAAEELAAIHEWIRNRRSLLAMREMDEVQRLADQINLTAQWAQTRATDAQLETISDGLLLALHDLRAVLVRRHAERLPEDSPGK